MLRPRKIADADMETALAKRLSDFLHEEKSLSGPVAWQLDGRAFCALAAERWHIEEIVNTVEPPWQYDLALPPGRHRSTKGQES